MSFTHAEFLFFFLPFALLAQRLALGRSKGVAFPNVARVVLIALSLHFYGYSHGWWIAPFLAATLFDYGWALFISSSENPTRRRIGLVLSVIQNVGLFCFFRYAWDKSEIPAGISFYTFESLSYVIDVYRRQIPPARNPLRVLSFLAMFPRFVAGPIVRYKDMDEQFSSYRGMEIEKGLSTFLLGYCFKTLFADSFAVFTGYAFRVEPETLHPLSAWIGMLAYHFQIYFDFAGYSLMAIGLGKCLGFDFPANFDRPYTSTSLREFWKRWHITLSTWLRDYVYVPLGGDTGDWRTYRNLFLVFALCGAWHGATWGFVLWGVWHGAFVVIERVVRSRVRLSPVVGGITTFLVVIHGWVLFRAPTLTVAGDLFLTMWGMGWRETFNPAAIPAHPVSLVLCCAGVWYAMVGEKLDWNPERFVVGKILLVCSALFGILLSLSSGMIPFLYFQF